MEFVIWIETRIAGRTADIQPVATVERPAGIKAAEEIGLSLADGKVVIRQIQRRLVEMQFEVESKLARMRSIFVIAGQIADELATAGMERVQRLRSHLLDLRNYLVSNQGGLTNYAHAYRHGLRISSAPAESGMNHLVNQRMGKHQPMRWSAEGAHLLLQVRCAVVDRRLENLFREQYPMFRALAPAMSAAPM